MEDRTLGRCLTEYAGGGYYPYHMPGHKRRGAQGGSFFRSARSVHAV